MIRKVLYYALLLFMLMLGAGKAWVDDQLNTAVMQAIEQARPQTLIDYQDVRLTWPGQIIAQQVHIQSADSPTLHIQQLHLHQLYRFIQAAGDMPEHWHITSDDTRLSLQFLQDLPDTQALWQMLGYQNYYLSGQEWRNLLGQHVSADIDIQAQWSADKDTLEATVQSHSTTLGDMTLQLSLHHVQASQANRQKLKIAALQLTWQPGQGFKRLSQYWGQRQNPPLNAQQVRQQLADKITQDLQKNKLLDAPAHAALHAFVQDLQALPLRLQPKIPFSLPELFNLPPQHWTERMGLSFVPE